MPRNERSRCRETSVHDAAKRAGGFCIMTNGTIDATLFDKMDGIHRNRGIQMTHWSRNELERFLAHHRELRDRYFR